MESGVNAVAFDGGDSPTTGGVERGSQLFLADGMRAGIGTFIAEAQHKQGCVALGHGRQTRQVSRPLGGVEGVEQSAVEHGLKHATKAFELKCVGRNELNRDPAVAGLLAGDCQCGFRHVDAYNRQSQRSDEKCMFAGAAAGIEHRSGEFTFGCQARDCQLRTANIPGRRLVAKVRRIPGQSGYPFMTGGVPAFERVVSRSISRVF